MIRIGVARNAPIGPHNHVQNARAKKTIEGLRLRFRPTMFGVTTPCVDHARRRLEERGLEVVVFHATGVGGQSMEKLADSGLLQGVIDVSTTEVADEIVGGVLSAGPTRMDVFARRFGREGPTGGAHWDYPVGGEALKVSA